MGNCLSSDPKKKSFKDVKNSVVLTKQKTDKKTVEENLKIVNKNFQGNYLFIKYLHR